MYKVLASAEVWHAGIQLCCRDDPEVIVMAGVCVFLGLGAGCVPGVGEGRAGAGSGQASLSVKGSGSKEIMLVCGGLAFPGMGLQPFCV